MLKSYWELLDPLTGSGEGSLSASFGACATASEIGETSSFLTFTFRIGFLKGLDLKKRLPSVDRVETLTDSEILTYPPDLNVCLVILRNGDGGDCGSSRLGMKTSSSELSVWNSSDWMEKSLILSSTGDKLTVRLWSSHSRDWLVFCFCDVTEWVDDCEASFCMEFVSSLKWRSEDALASREMLESSFSLASSSWTSS